jgi:hypothetical protein
MYLTGSQTSLLTLDKLKGTVIFALEGIEGCYLLVSA